MDRNSIKYNVEDLKRNLETIDKNIERVKSVIDTLMKENEEYQKRINDNKKNIQVFYVEIARMEEEKSKLMSLINNLTKNNG